MKNRVYIATVYQCPRGELDIARLFQYFNSNDWDITDTPSDADLVVVGGCAFTQSVEDQSINHLSRIKQMMRPGVPLVVGGCISVINAERIRKAIHGSPTDVIDGEYLDSLIAARVPLNDIEAAHSLDYTHDRPGQIVPNNNASLSDADFSARILPSRFFRWFRYGKPQTDFNSTNENVFYIRVARGCLDECKYCSIKFSSSRLRSKPVDEINMEFEKGLAEGYRIFYLMGEDVGAYGQDLDISITDLLSSILRHGGSYQLVISDCNPRWLVRYSAEFLELFSKHADNILQLEIPVQSGSDRVLLKMGRKYSIRDVEKCIRELREVTRSTRLKTHMIIGFPGETRNDFRQTLDFLKRVRFDCIASYVYSDRPDTEAIKLPNKVPALIKTLRYWRFNREAL